VLWVSEGPHTLGAYRRIDLGARLRNQVPPVVAKAPPDDLQHAGAEAPPGDAATIADPGDDPDDRVADPPSDVAEYESRGDVPPDPLLALGVPERLRLGAAFRRAAERERSAERQDAAIEEYERAVALRADDHLAWRGLAESRAAAGDAAGASAAWQRVVDLVPESPAAYAEARQRSPR